MILQKIKNIFKNKKQKDNEFRDYIVNCYTYYSKNQSNNYLFQKYQTYREVMEHYDLKLKLEIDKKVKE